MNRLLPLLLLVVAAAAPAAASAKELAGVKVCGADGCERLRGAAAVGLEHGGPMAPPPKSAADFYTLELGVRVDGQIVEQLTTTYVPEHRMLKGDDGTWMTLPPDVVRTLERAVAGLKPFPASKLTGLDRSTQLPEAQVHAVYASAPAPASSGGGLPWALVGGLAAAALALVLLARAVRMPRPSRRAA